MRDSDSDKSSVRDVFDGSLKSGICLIFECPLFWDGACVVGVGRRLWCKLGNWKLEAEKFIYVESGDLGNIDSQRQLGVA
jgi:hypothetical protein